MGYRIGESKFFSVCCTPEPPDYDSLLPDEKQKFCYLVNQFRKQGINLKTAQVMALQQVLCESIPFDS